MDVHGAGADLWIRASHNKLAQEDAAWWARLWSNVWSWTLALLVAVPFLLASWALFLFGSKAADAVEQYRLLSLVSTMSSGAALVVVLVNPGRRRDEAWRRHADLACSYGRIAQRARRLERMESGDAAAVLLLQCLDEDMTAQKAAGFEASAQSFNRAHRHLARLTPLPFGIQESLLAEGGSADPANHATPIAVDESCSGADAHG